MKANFTPNIFLLTCLLLTAAGCNANATTRQPSNPPTETRAVPIITTAPVATPVLPNAAATAITPPTATTGASSSASGACDMPYFPVKAGAVWKYRYVAGGLTTDETFNITTVSPNGFARRISFSNIPGNSEEQWTCSDQGLSNPQMSNMTTSGGGSATQVRVLNHTGISLPPASQWKVGATWSESSQLEETIAIGGKPGSPFQAAIDETNKIVGEEKVMVPAGTFTALRIDSTLVEHLGQTNVSIPTTSWFARGVGQVKVTADSSGASVTVELLSFTP